MATTHHSPALSILVTILSLGALQAAGAAALPETWFYGAGGFAAVANEPQTFAAQLPQRRELTLAEAIMVAQGRYPGRVVRAQTLQLGNGAVHEVRIIGNDGLVHTVRIDARTGAVQ